MGRLLWIDGVEVVRHTVENAGARIEMNCCNFGMAGLLHQSDLHPLFTMKARMGGFREE